MLFVCVFLCPMGQYAANLFHIFVVVGSIRYVHKQNKSMRKLN